VCKVFFEASFLHGKMYVHTVYQRFFLCCQVPLLMVHILKVIIILLVCCTVISAIFAALGCWFDLLNYFGTINFVIFAC